MADLDDLPPEVSRELTFVPVETLDEVLATALRPADGAVIANLGLMQTHREAAQAPFGQR
jgi:hypothetical protein